MATQPRAGDGAAAAAAAKEAPAVSYLQACVRSAPPSIVVSASARGALVGSGSHPASLSVCVFI